MGRLNVLVPVFQPLKIEKISLLKSRNAVNMSYYFHGDARKKCNPSYTLCFIFFIIRFFIFLCLHHLNGASVLLLKRNRTNVDDIVITAFEPYVSANILDIEIVFKKLLKNCSHWCDCLV